MRDKLQLSPAPSRPGAADAAGTALRLHCIRHGRTTVSYPRTPFLSSASMNAIMDAYDQAGLAESGPVQPARPLGSTFAISSDLPRAIETAELLTGLPRAQMRLSSVYREVPLPRFETPSLRLPAPVLFGILRMGWLTGTMAAPESHRETKARVVRAADEIEELVMIHKEVSLFSHGFFLLLLGRELRRRGWSVPSLLPYGYLERRVFERRLGQGERTGG